jgi:hypothetical protein
MGEMTAYTLEELVSQAESGGVTLAELLSSRLSANDLDRIQGDLSRAMAENYRSIEGFMSGIEVPSIADFSELSETDLDDAEALIRAALSDEAPLARC